MAEIFYKVLSHDALKIVEVGKGLGMTLTGEVSKRIVCPMEHAFALERSKASLLLKKFHIVLHVENCKSRERPDELSPSTLWKSNINHRILFIALYRVFAVICIDKGTFGEGAVEVV